MAEAEQLAGGGYPDFSVQPAGGGAPIRLSKHLNNGLPSLVCFYSSWCQTTREHVAKCEQLAELFAGRANLVLVNVGQNAQQAAKIEAKNQQKQAKIAKAKAGAGGIGEGSRSQSRKGGGKLLGADMDEPSLMGEPSDKAAKAKTASLLARPDAGAGVGARVAVGLRDVGVAAPRLRDVGAGDVEGDAEDGTGVGRTVGADEVCVTLAKVSEDASWPALRRDA